MKASAAVSHPGILSGVKERAPSDATRVMPPTLPTVTGFPAVFHRDAASEVAKAPSRLPSSSSRFAQAMRAGKSAAAGLSVPSSAIGGAGDAPVAREQDGEKSVRGGGAAAGPWIVDDRVRLQNKAMIQGMSPEELKETMDSVESVLGPALFAKLQAMYGAGGSLRGLGVGDEPDEKNSDATASAPAPTESMPPAAANSGCKQGCYGTCGHSSATMEPSSLLAALEPSEEPYLLDDTYESRQPTDLVLRCRSLIASQRAQAFRRLTELLLLGAARTGEKYPRVLPVVLRCGADDSHASVLPEALRALLVFLGCELPKLTEGEDADCDEWEALFPLHRGCEAPPARRPHWNMQSLRGAPDSDAEDAENEEDRDDPAGDDAQLQGDPDAEACIRNPARGLLKMGLLDRIVYLIEVAKCPQHILELCLRIAIGCARSGPSASWTIIEHPQLLKLLCNSAFTGDGWPQSCLLLVIRLLRWLSTAGRSACEQLCSRGFVGLTKRFLIGEHSEIVVSEVLRLWRVCLAYGLDAGSFQAVFPPLLLRRSVRAMHREADSSESVQPRAITEYCDVVNVLEAACWSRRVEDDPPTFDNVLDAQLCSVVKTCLPALHRCGEGKVSRDEWPAVASLLHFLASYYDVSIGEGDVTTKVSAHSTLTAATDSDMSPWCIPLSVVAANSHSRSKVATWLLQNVIAPLCSSSPSSLANTVSAVLQQSSGEPVFAAVNLWHALVRLLSCVVKLLPGHTAVGDLITANTASLVNTVGAVASSCDALWAHPSSPILYQKLDGNPLPYYSVRFCRFAVAAAADVLRDRVGGAQAVALCGAAAHVAQLHVPGDEALTASLLADAVLYPQLLQAVCGVELRDALALRSTLLPLFQHCLFAEEDVERGQGLMSRDPAAISSLQLRREQDGHDEPCLALSQCSSVQLYFAPWQWARLPDTRPAEVASCDWTAAVGASLRFVAGVVHPALPSHAAPLLARALLEVAMCSPVMLTSLGAKTAYVTMYTAAFLGNIAVSPFPSLTALMGETRLTQLGLSVTEHYASQGFGVDACTLATVLFLRPGAPAMCRGTVWKDVVGTGLGRNSFLPSSLPIAAIVASCADDAGAGLTHAEFLVDVIATRKLRPSPSPEESCAVFYEIALRQLAAFIFADVDAGATPSDIALSRLVLVSKLARCEATVMASLLAAGAKDSSAVEARQAAVSSALSRVLSPA